MPYGIHSDEETHAFVANVMIAQRETWLALGGRDRVGIARIGRFRGGLVVRRSGGSVTRRRIGADQHASTCRPNGLALWVFESNRRAQAFYERHGFVSLWTAPTAPATRRRPQTSDMPGWVGERGARGPPRSGRASRFASRIPLVMAPSVRLRASTTTLAGAKAQRQWVGNEFSPAIPAPTTTTHRPAWQSRRERLPARRRTCHRSSAGAPS